MKILIKKNDLILIMVLLVAAVASFIVLQMNKKEGDQARISVSGNVKQTLKLDSDARIRVETQNGYNIVVVKDKKIYIEDADCAGKDCVHQGEISSSGESIVCLPHQLVVEIIGKDKSLDGMAQ